MTNDLRSFQCRLCLFFNYLCPHKNKTKKQQLTKQKKTLDKKSTEYTDFVEKEKELKQEEKDWKNKIKEYEETHYKKPIAKFRSLTKSVKKYEILCLDYQKDLGCFGNRYLYIDGGFCLNERGSKIFLEKLMNDLKLLGGY